MSVTNGPVQPNENLPAQPAFQFHRFKKALVAFMNEPFAAELLAILNAQKSVGKHMFAFRQKLDQRLNDNYIKGQPYIDRAV